MESRFIISRGQEAEWPAKDTQGPCGDWNFLCLDCINVKILDVSFTLVFKMSPLGEMGNVYQDLTAFFLTTVCKCTITLKLEIQIRTVATM